MVLAEAKALIRRLVTARVVEERTRTRVVVGQETRGVVGASQTAGHEVATLGTPVRRSKDLG
jgi:hypothetical protein